MGDKSCAGRRNNVMHLNPTDYAWGAMEWIGGK